MSKRKPRMVDKSLEIDFDIPEKPRKSDCYVSTYIGVDRGDAHEEMEVSPAVSQND